MKERTVQIRNETGLHARPASLFVKAAQLFTADIKVKKGDRLANAKSIMEVMVLGAGKGDTINLIADGEDEEQAVTELTRLIESGFGYD